MHDILQGCPLVIEPGMPVVGSISRDLLDAQAEVQKLNLQIGLWRKYVALLGEELREVAPIAFDRGWRTTRHEEGKKLREQLGLGEYWSESDKQKVEVPSPAGEEWPPKSCNRHNNCQAASAKYVAENGREPGVNFHCWSEDCEDCFGK
jgi:hypothetical protein